MRYFFVALLVFGMASAIPKDRYCTLYSANLTFGECDELYAHYLTCGQNVTQVFQYNITHNHTTIYNYSTLYNYTDVVYYTLTNNFTTVVQVPTYINSSASCTGLCALQKQMDEAIEYERYKALQCSFYPDLSYCQEVDAIPVKSDFADSDVFVELMSRLNSLEQSTPTPIPEDKPYGMYLLVGLFLVGVGGFAYFNRGERQLPATEVNKNALQTVYNEVMAERSKPQPSVDDAPPMWKK